MKIATLMTRRFGARMPEPTTTPEAPRLSRDEMQGLLRQELRTIEPLAA